MPSIPERLTSRNPLRNLAVADRQALFACLGAALAFWLILNLSREYSIRQDVYLEYRTEAERVLAGSPPDSLSVEISGSGWNLLWESLRSGPLVVSVDLNGSETTRLTRTDLSSDIERVLSSGELSVSDLDFDGVTLLTTPLEGKRVPLRPRLRLGYRPGYLAAGEPVLIPDSITISGAADALEEITEWPTAERALEDIAESVDADVELAAPPAGLRLSYRRVRLRLPVTAHIQERFLVPVEIINPPPTADSVLVIPDAVELEVSVTQDRYGTYNATDFRLVADLGREQLLTTEGANTVALRLAVQPAGVVSARLHPAAVEFYVFRR